MPDFISIDDPTPHFDLDSFFLNDSLKLVCSAQNCFSTIKWYRSESRYDLELIDFNATTSKENVMITNRETSSFQSTLTICGGSPEENAGWFTCELGSDQLRRYVRGKRAIRHQSL